MKTFKQKVEQLAKLKDKLAKSKLTVFTSFVRAGEKGLNVAEMKELKKTLRVAEAEYLVSKKSLLNRALKGAVSVFQFSGSVGVAFGYGDEAATARNLYGFAKKNPAMKFFGALFGGKFIDDGQFIELAKLPTKEIMISRAVSMIKYPLSGLVNILGGNLRNLVIVLGQVANSK